MLLHDLESNVNSILSDVASP